MELAERAGEKIPLGWARDLHGNPTNDTTEGKKGHMEPMAGHKGTGLSIMFEILCSIMTGAAFGDDTLGDKNLGHFFMALDITRFMPAEMFASRLDEYLANIHSGEPIRAGERIFVPGEIEAETSAKRRVHGIPLPSDQVAEMIEIGERLELPFDLEPVVI